jgi:hypothetical protein
MFFVIFQNHILGIKDKRTIFTSKWGYMQYKGFHSSILFRLDLAKTGRGCLRIAYYDSTLQRTNTENSKQRFPEKDLRGHIPNFHIHVSVRDPQEICAPFLGLYKSLTDT